MGDDAIFNTYCDEPNLDSVIDKMLTERDSKGVSDPLDPGLFPSLGFPNEQRGSYFIQVEQGDLLVSVWRIVGANGEPASYNIHPYRKHVHNGITSWGGRVDSRVMVDDLVQVQAIIHNILTSEGNGEIT